MDSIVCDRCDYSGYAPNAAVILSRGELECPSCDGFDTPHGQCTCACDASDASGHECDLSCPECDGGIIKCDHGGQPDIEYMSMWHVETTNGTEYIPTDLVGTEDPDLGDYLEGEESEEPEREMLTGWYARLSAPGYMDRTDWMGPYSSEHLAMLSLCEHEDICPICYEACYDGPEPCAEEQVEAETKRLEKLAAKVPA